LTFDATMRLHLGGHLNWYDPQKRARLEIPLAAPVLLLALLEQLHVPPAEVAILTINGRLTQLEGAVVADGDRVEVYPAIGGGGYPVSSICQCSEFPV